MANKPRHGMANRSGRHPLYIAWDNMLGRCNRKTHPQFHYYGARGILVCEEWLRFDPFMEWAMNNGWEKGLTLDRSDNEKGYSPENCRWVAHSVQMSNTRWNIFYEFDGRRQTLSQWSREVGIGFKTLQGRLKWGWTPEKAFTTPVIKHEKTK